MLPGRLTTEHIEKAIARGDGYIQYRGMTYTIAELQELDEVGRWNQRTGKKSPSGKKSDGESDQERSGSVGERSGKARTGEAPAGEELTEIGSSGPPE